MPSDKRTARMDALWILIQLRADNALDDDLWIKIIRSKNTCSKPSMSDRA